MTPAPSGHGLDAAHDGDVDGPSPDACPRCGGTVLFVAHIAAPGYGQSWHCSSCEHPFVRLNAASELLDAREHMFELDPEDVR